MSHLSYENRVAIFLGVSIISTVVLLVVFFFVQKSNLSNAQVQISTPNIDLTEVRSMIHDLQLEQTTQATDEQEQESTPSVQQEQEQNTPLKKQTTQE